MINTHYLPLFLVLLVTVSVALGCAGRTPVERETVHQVSTLNALIDGAYESDVRVDRLTGPDMIGLGTPNHVNGEMIILGRTAYRVDASGTVHELAPEVRTPFAVSSSFDADTGVPLDYGVEYSDVKERADELLVTPNYIQAIRVRGTFSSMTVRSVPRQEPPYRPLTEVIKQQQREFSYESVEGVLVGFRFPGYMERLNAPGYHLHFLSTDRKKGGHVLDFTVNNARLELDTERRFDLVLPDHDLFRKADLSTHEQEAVESVEKQ